MKLSYVKIEKVVVRKDLVAFGAYMCMVLGIVRLEGGGGGKGRRVDGTKRWKGAGKGQGSGRGC